MLLIEVLIALLVLMVAAAGSLALLSSIIHSTQFSGQAQTASRLAQDLLDRALAEPFATVGTAGSACVAAEPGPNQTVYADGRRTDLTSGSPGNKVEYRRKCTVQTLGIGAGAGLKVIRVRVEFQDETGTWRTIRLGVQRAS
jgi:type II secretory pathway pseudopilin PulG